MDLWTNQNFNEFAMINIGLPFVSVIIINYNSFKYTHNCITSIIEQSKGLLNFEIIVIDNNSKAPDLEKLDSLLEFSKVKLIKSPVNMGFSGGNMAGVAVASASADYYFFLNNDCILVNDVISILSSFMNNSANAGVLTAQMFNAEREIQPSFEYFPSVGNLLFGRRFMALFNKDMYASRNALYTLPRLVPVATGSAMFVRSLYFKEIGGFDTRYFLYCEEEDLCLRMRNKGWKTYLVPEARFIHFEGRSTHRNIAIEKEFFISFYYYLSKFHSPFSRIIIKGIYLIKIFKRVIKKRVSFELFKFLLIGAPEKESIKYKN